MGFINDFASSINPDTRTVMENTACELFNKTGIEFLVVIMKNIPETNSYEYADRLFEAWQIGQARGDDGILLLFVTDDRLQIIIKTSNALSDMLSEDVLQENTTAMMHYISEQTNSAGLYKGFRAIVDIIARDRNVEISGQLPDDHIRTYGIAAILCCLIVIVAIILIIRIRNSSNRIYFRKGSFGGLSVESSGSFGGGIKSDGFGAGLSGMQCGMSGKGHFLFF